MRKIFSLTIGLCLAVLFAPTAQAQYSICRLDSVQMSTNPADLFEWIPATGLDDPFSPTPTASPATTTTYTVRRLITSTNLIANGDFEAGATGFASQYRDSTDINREGYYAITTNPTQNHIAMNPCQDHTSGQGRMMVINGDAVANRTVWEQVISVTPNTNYAFSAWINTGVSGGSEATLQFSIGGQLIGSQFVAQFRPCSWRQFYATWNSGTATTAIIRLVNRNTAREGNDFALDDIQFRSFVTNTEQKTVTVKPIDASPTVTAGDLTPCQGQTTTLTGPSGKAGYIWNDGLTDASRTVSADGDFVLRTLGSNQCYSFPSDTVRVRIQPLPNAPVISVLSGSTSICPGDSMQLQATAGDSYLWSTGATGQVLTVRAGGTYTAQAVSAQGCQSVASNPITVSQRSRPSQPRVTLSGDTVFCQGGSLTITSSFSTNNFWSTGATTRAITVTESGQYWVYAQASSQGACPSLKRFINVSVSGAGQRPVITAQGATTLCPGGSVVLTSNFPNGNVWSNGATTQSITVTQAGSYTVTTTTPGCGAATSVAVQVLVATVGAAPTISAPANRNLCTGETITLTSSAALGNLWSNGATSASITVSEAGTYTVRQVVGACTTAASQGITVTVAPRPSRPSVSAGSATTFCEGGSVILTSSAAAGNLWSNGATTASITVSAGGRYYVRATAQGCTSDTSRHVLVRVNAAPPIPTITPPSVAPLCEGQTVTLTSSHAGDNLWSNGANSRSITLQGVGSQTYSVQALSSEGCPSGNSPGVTVTINPRPATPTITGPTSVCPGNTVTLTSSASTGNVWSTGATTSTLNAGPGTYTVQTVAQGCSSLVSTPLTVTQVSLTAPTISAGGPTTFCQGGSVTLSSPSAGLWSNGQTSSSITVSSSGSFTLRTVAQGCTSQVSQPVVVTVNPLPAAPVIRTETGSAFACAPGWVNLLTNASGTTVWSTGIRRDTLRALTTGAYSARTVALGCTSQVSNAIDVTINQTPATPVVTPAGALQRCDGETVTFTSSAQNGNVWSTGDTTRSITVTSSTTVFAVVVAQRCSSAMSNNVTITFNQRPAQPTVEALGADSLQASVAADGYVWTLDGNVLPVISRKIRPVATGTYAVVAVNLPGCQSAASQGLLFTLTGLQRGTTAGNLHLAPNPADGYILLKGLAPGTQLEVVDATGRVWVQQGASDVTHTLPLPTMPAGAYMLRAKGADGRVQTARFVKQ